MENLKSFFSRRARYCVNGILLSILLLPLLPGALCHAQKLSKSHHKDARAEAVRANMRRAFGGEKKLKALDYVSYSLSRTVYRDEDTATTEQLWFVHMRKPLVIKLEINGQDTTMHATDLLPLISALENQEERAVHERLLRSRFFNFLYLLHAPEADFAFIAKQTYQSEPVDVIRVTDRLDQKVSLDLFVNREGEVVTSSTIDPESGQYEVFGDEFAYERIAGGLVFPLQYKVVQLGKLLVEGTFSNMQVNRLSPFWERQLRLLGIKP